MYDVTDYGMMLGDRRRMGSYASALRETVRPGAVVVEIGAGPGTLAVVAAQLGARHVYAIEPNAVIQVAREVVASNGVGDRVSCIQGLSTSVALPERADVIVSDLRDVLPLFSQHIASIVDARTRLLAEGGVLVPSRDRLWAAVVTAPEVYERQVGAWDDQGLGVDLSAGRTLVVNSWCKARLDAAALLVEPHQWAAIDYTSVTDPNVSGEIRFTVSRPGVAHGLCLWFDTQLTDTVGFSNAPGAPAHLYGQAFFPWPEPVPLAEGHRIDVRLRATLVGDDYVWQWDSRIERGPDDTRAFSQSTFHAQLLPIVTTAPKPAAQRVENPVAPLVAGEVDERELADALSAGFWRALNPHMSLGTDRMPDWFGRVPVDGDRITRLAERFRDEGYFDMPPTLPLPVMQQMRHAVETLRAHGWPAVFAFVYDEFWLLSRTAPIAAFVEQVLGSGYRQIPHVWTHYVTPRPGATG